MNCSILCSVTTSLIMGVASLIMGVASLIMEVASLIMGVASLIIPTTTTNCQGCLFFFSFFSRLTFVSYFCKLLSRSVNLNIKAYLYALMMLSLCFEVLKK